MPKLGHSGYPAHLPDFSNLGVMLRIVLGTEWLTCMAAWLQASSPASNFWANFLNDSLLIQPSLLLTLLFLHLANRALARLPFLAGAVAIAIIALFTVELVLTEMTHLFVHVAPQKSLHIVVNTLGVTTILLAWLWLLQRALSPALTEARLQALQARIRPHFLFNTLNAVLSLIRTNPQAAEQALENLAELYRAMLSDTRQLVPLALEVERCRQYLSLETLRLGNRLRLVWHTDKIPADALVPPLLLQPLAENAVYHGIEPLPDGGEICINLYSHQAQIHLVINNDYDDKLPHRSGGHNLALENIRQRLMLHFDMEASVHKRISHNSYQIHIILPYRTKPR